MARYFSLNNFDFSILPHNAKIETCHINMMAAQKYLLNAGVINLTLILNVNKKEVDTINKRLSVCINETQKTNSLAKGDEILIIAMKSTPHNKITLEEDYLMTFYIIIVE